MIVRSFLGRRPALVVECLNRLGECDLFVFDPVFRQPDSPGNTRSSEDTAPRHAGRPPALPNQHDPPSFLAQAYQFSTVRSRAGERPGLYPTIRRDGPLPSERSRWPVPGVRSLARPRRLVLFHTRYLGFIEPNWKYRARLLSCIVHDFARSANDKATSMRSTVAFFLGCADSARLGARLAMRSSSASRMFHGAESTGKRKASALALPNPHVVAATPPT